MKTIINSIFEQKIRENMKEMIINIIIDNFCSYSIDLSVINVEFDKEDPTLIHVKLPTIIPNNAQSRIT